jgi:tetratricopeptide (TPR) repeat protein
MRNLVLSLLMALACAASGAAQSGTARELFEAGKHQEAVDAVKAEGGAAPPADVYLAAQSLAKLDRRDEARELLQRLEGGGDESAWTFVARSVSAVLDGDNDKALDAANRAVELGPDDFHTHYQLGLVDILRNDFTGAAAAFQRATEINPDDAYAHYYAGIAYNKTRKIDKMASHFRSFLTLAPDAPERGQVEQILRTLRR